MMIHEITILRKGTCWRVVLRKAVRRAVLECPDCNNKSVATQAIGHRDEIKSLGPSIISPVVFDVLDRVDNFVDKLEGDAGYNTFSIRERTLKGTQSNPSFLC